MSIDIRMPLVLLQRRKLRILVVMATSGKNFLARAYEGAGVRDRGLGSALVRGVCTTSGGLILHKLGSIFFSLWIYFNRHFLFRYACFLFVMLFVVILIFSFLHS